MLANHFILQNKYLFQKEPPILNAINLITLMKTTLDTINDLWLDWKYSSTLH